MKEFIIKKDSKGLTTVKTVLYMEKQTSDDRFAFYYLSEVPYKDKISVNIFEFRAGFSSVTILSTLFDSGISFKSSRIFKCYLIDKDFSWIEATVYSIRDNKEEVAKDIREIVSYYSLKLYLDTEFEKSIILLKNVKTPFDMFQCRLYKDNSFEYNSFVGLASALKSHAQLKDNSPINIDILYSNGEIVHIHLDKVKYGIHDLTRFISYEKGGKLSKISLEELSKNYRYGENLVSKKDLVINFREYLPIVDVDKFLTNEKYAYETEVKVLGNIEKLFVGRAEESITEDEVIEFRDYIGEQWVEVTVDLLNNSIHIFITHQFDDKPDPDKSYLEGVEKIRTELSKSLENIHNDRYSYHADIVQISGQYGSYPTTEIYNRSNYGKSKSKSKPKSKSKKKVQIRTKQSIFENIDKNLTEIEKIGKEIDLDLGVPILSWYKSINVDIHFYIVESDKGDVSKQISILIRVYDKSGKLMRDVKNSLLTNDSPLLAKLLIQSKELVSNISDLTDLIILDDDIFVIYEIRTKSQLVETIKSGFLPIINVYEFESKKESLALFRKSLFTKQKQIIILAIVRFYYMISGEWQSRFNEVGDSIVNEDIHELWNDIEKITSPVAYDIDSMIDLGLVNEKMFNREKITKLYNSMREERRSGKYKDGSQSCDKCNRYLYLKCNSANKVIMAHSLKELNNWLKNSTKSNDCTLYLNIS